MTFQGFLDSVGKQRTEVESAGLKGHVLLGLMPVVERQQELQGSFIDDEKVTE